MKKVKYLCDDYVGLSHKKGDIIDAFLITRKDNHALVYIPPIDEDNECGSLSICYLHVEDSSVWTPWRPPHHGAYLNVDSCNLEEIVRAFDTDRIPTTKVKSRSKVEKLESSVTEEAKKAVDYMMLADNVESILLRKDLSDWEKVTLAKEIIRLQKEKDNR